MRQLGPDNWSMPLFWSIETTTLGAIKFHMQLTELRPDDWFVYFMRGIFYYYMMYDLEQARADFEQSIALRPIANLPYVSLTMIALREGRMADAQALLVTILTEYPDPEMTNRALRAVYGGGYDFTGTFFAASTNYALGQYDNVVAQIQTFTDYIFSLPDSGELIDQSLIQLSDIYLLQGLAHCNLKSYAAAESAYDKAIAYSKDFDLLYVLRGQMRSRQGKRAAAEEDFAAAREADLGPEFAAWVESGAHMEWTCETMQDYQPPG
jgi:tetratricopeptide (TPR) repeat protein